MSRQPVTHCPRCGFDGLEASGDPIQLTWDLEGTPCCPKCGYDVYRTKATCMATYQFNEVQEQLNLAIAAISNASAVMKEGRIPLTNHCIIDTDQSDETLITVLRSRLERARQPRDKRFVNTVEIMQEDYITLLCYSLNYLRSRKEV